MTTEKITSAQLDAAADALGEVLRFERPADGVLSNFFHTDTHVGQRDRAFVAEAVYGVLRRLRRVRLAAGDAVGARKLILAWLARCEGFSQRQLEPLLSRGEVDWMIQVRGGPQPSTIAERCDMPDWLAERLLVQMGEEKLQAVADCLNRTAPLDLRVNSLKADRDAVLARFKEEGIAASATPYSPLGIRLAGKPALQKHPLFLDGSIEVQDEGSQLLGFMLAPKRSEMVVDFCAGAGGKTLLLGALMRSTGRLYAFDVSEKRLARMKPRAARSGLSNIHPAAIAHENDARIKRLAGKIDRVLVDAPCSGLGTLRRNPDLKWRQKESDVAELSAKQIAILNAASNLVKVGGRLVYATCSLLAEENDAIVDAFLASHPGFEQESAREIMAAAKIDLDTGERLRLDPAAHGTDGFFAVAMKRKS